METSKLTNAAYAAACMHQAAAAFCLEVVTMDPCGASTQYPPDILSAAAELNWEIQNALSDGEPHDFELPPITHRPWADLEPGKRFDAMVLHHFNLITGCAKMAVGNLGDLVDDDCLDCYRALRDALTSANENYFEVDFSL